jgi:MFS family permease
VLIATIGNALDKPLISVVAPVYAERYFGNGEVLGLIVGAFGGGALIGTLAYGQWARRLPRRATFLSCFVLSPLLGFGALALRPSLATVVIAAVLAGVAAGPINPIYETVIQQQAPPHMLGRVFGTITALAYAGIPLGAILAGVLIEQIGLIQTIVGMGALYLLVTGSAWFLPVLRGIDAQPEPPRAVSSGVELGPVYTPARGAAAGSGVASDIRP